MIKRLFHKVGNFIISIFDRIKKLFTIKSKKRYNYQFQKVLDSFKPYEKLYCLTYEQTGQDTRLLIESKVKPSKPSKRASMSLKSGKAEEIAQQPQPQEEEKTNKKKKSKKKD